MEDYNFETIMINAIKRCEGMIIEDKAFRKGFHQIYPFATENISGYIENFELPDKSLLTVGSSLDQVLNAITYDCKDITVADINPYIKYYYNLKKAALLELNKAEFLKFFCYKDYPKVFKDNPDVFNISTYNRIKQLLRILDYESYLFWDELFQNFSPFVIRQYLFSSDEYRLSVTTNINSYLKDSKKYKLLKEKIINSKVNFIHDDLFKLEINDTYDNIWLSNIGTYISRHFLKILVDKLNDYLNGNGKMLVSYLYETPSKISFQEDWSPIYNLDKLFEEMTEYKLELLSFIGIKGIKFDDDDIKDSILVYKKNNKTSAF